MTNAAEAIPFKSEREKYYIIKRELKKNRYVEVWDKYIYTAVKWGGKRK